MNKNAVYLSVFAALCVLAGVLVGASITKRPNLPWPGPQGPDFRERAERFMGYGQREPQDRRGGGGPIEMLTAKLGLSAKQQAKVTEILEKRRQEIDELGKNVRSAIAEIREKGDKLIMDILTPQQQEKFKALQRGYGPQGPGGERGPAREYGPSPGEELPPPQE
jgi:Spy/CpxP family protein refolding chaperone